MPLAQRFDLARVCAGDPRLPDVIAKLQLVMRANMLEALYQGNDAAAGTWSRALELSQWALAAAQDTNVSKRLLMENLFLAI